MKGESGVTGLPFKNESLPELIFDLPLLLHSLHPLLDLLRLLEITPIDRRSVDVFSVCFPRWRFI